MGSREPKSLPEFRIVPWTDEDAFRARWGRPADPHRWSEWEAGRLPQAGDQRRRAARYMLDLRGSACALCELPIDPELETDHRHPARLTIDHIVPTAKHGGDTWANARPAHWACNAERRDELVPLDSEWLRALLAAEIEKHVGGRSAASVSLLRVEHYASALEVVEAAIEEEKASPHPKGERLDSLVQLPFNYRALIGEWTARARDFGAG